MEDPAVLWRGSIDQIRDVFFETQTNAIYMCILVSVVALYICKT